MCLRERFRVHELAQALGGKVVSLCCLALGRIPLHDGLRIAKRKERKIWPRTSSTRAKSPALFHALFCHFVIQLVEQVATTPAHALVCKAFQLPITTCGVRGCSQPGRI